MPLSPDQTEAAGKEEINTFPRLLLNHARVRGEKIAMREKDLGIWQAWTWQQVLDEVRAMACGLASLGFEATPRSWSLGRLSSSTSQFHRRAR